MIRLVFVFAIQVYITNAVVFKSLEEQRLIEGKLQKVYGYRVDPSFSGVAQTIVFEDTGNNTILNVTFEPHYVQYTFNHLTECYDVGKESMKVISKCNWYFAGGIGAYFSQEYTVDACDSNYNFQSKQIRRYSTEAERAFSDGKDKDYQAIGFAYRFCFRRYSRYSRYEQNNEQEITLNSIKIRVGYRNESTRMLTSEEISQFFSSDLNSLIPVSQRFRRTDRLYEIVKTSEGIYYCKSSIFDRYRTSSKSYREAPTYNNPCHSSSAGRDSSNELLNGPESNTQDCNIMWNCDTPRFNWGGRGSHSRADNLGSPQVDLQYSECKANRGTNYILPSFPVLTDDMTGFGCVFLSSLTQITVSACKDDYCFDPSSSDQTIVLNERLLSLSGTFFSPLSANKSVIAIPCLISFVQCERLSYNSTEETLASQVYVYSIGQNPDCPIYTSANNQTVQIYPQNSSRTPAKLVNISIYIPVILTITNPNSSLVKQCIVLPIGSLENALASKYTFNFSSYMNVNWTAIFESNNFSFLGDVVDFVKRTGEQILDAIKKGFCELSVIGALCDFKQKVLWFILAILGSLFCCVAVFLLLDSKNIQVRSGIAVVISILVIAIQLLFWNYVAIVALVLGVLGVAFSILRRFKTRKKQQKKRKKKKVKKQLTKDDQDSLPKDEVLDA
jgi:hypothetical protein